MTEPKAQATGMELVRQVIDPEIASFEAWFRQEAHGNSPLTSMEKEVLRAYLYQKLAGTL